MSDFERELKISAHKSEAPYLPYDPEINREYNAFIRGARWALKSSVVKQMLEAIKISEKLARATESPKNASDHVYIKSLRMKFRDIKREALSAYNEAIRERGE